MTSLVKYKTSEPVLDTLLNKFVDKALSDPSFFSEILNVENTKKFKDILFAQGQSFLDENDKLTFDEELKTFIDGNSHVLIKELIG